MLILNLTLLLSQTFQYKRPGYLGFTSFACVYKYNLLFLFLCPSKYIWITISPHAPPNMLVSVIFVQISASSLIMFLHLGYMRLQVYFGLACFVSFHIYLGYTSFACASKYENICYLCPNIGLLPHYVKS